MNRRLVVEVRNGLKDLLVVLISALSGGLWSALGTQYLRANTFPNFRVMHFDESLVMGIGYVWIVLVLYSLGIYSAAWLMRRFYTRHGSSFKPLSLVWGGVLGLTFGCMLTWQRIGTSGWDWGNVLMVGGISSILLMWVACRNKSFTVYSRRLIFGLF